jgi:hypothetical protein
MARDRAADQVEQLERDIARTRRDLAETWTALRQHLPLGRASSPGGRAITDPQAPVAASPPRTYAGGKPPRAGQTAGNSSGRRRLPASTVMVGLAGIALVLPRMIRKRRMGSDATDA